VSTTKLRDRIVGHARVSPQELIANDRNWRQHPSHQQRFLSGVLEQVGWVQSILVNSNTNTIVDGHLRVALAINRGEESVPVQYVDLDPDDEALVLATLDPLSSMATTDQSKLDDLLLETEANNESVEELLAMLASKTEDELPAASTRDSSPEEWGVIVMCASRDQQTEILNTLREQGLQVRTLTT
jgi:hypothetical protein